MKTLKEIRENQSVLLEKEDKKLTSLIRAGLFDVKKLPMLRRALSKDNTKLSPQERATLLELLDTLISLVTGDQQIYQRARTDVMREGYETAGDLPMVLVLKRRSIRIFPDGQRVALYWVDKLKTFISVPYSSMGVGYSANVSEEVSLKEIDNWNAMQVGNLISFNDGSQLEITEEMTKDIIELHDNLDESNQAILKKTLNESSEKFMEVLNFIYTNKD